MAAILSQPQCVNFDVLTLICVPFVYILCNILNPDKFTGFKTTIFIYSQKTQKNPNFTKYFINSLSQGQI